MFEMSGVGEKLAKDAIRLASHKLPLRTRFIGKESVTAMSSDTAE
jgi:large subunit ribosomal protein L16